MNDKQFCKTFICELLLMWQILEASKVINEWQPIQKEKDKADTLELNLIFSRLRKHKCFQPKSMRWSMGLPGNKNRFLCQKENKNNCTLYLRLSSATK